MRGILDLLSGSRNKCDFYNNAARFLKLSDQEVARHHGRD